jgi:hypothetical protein
MEYLLEHLAKRFGPVYLRCDLKRGDRPNWGFQWECRIDGYGKAYGATAREAIEAAEDLALTLG